MLQQKCKETLASFQGPKVPGNLAESVEKYPLNNRTTKNKL